MMKIISRLALGVFTLLSTFELHAQSWTTMSVGTTADVFDISFPSVDTGFATLGNGTARKTFDGGVTWSNLNLHDPNGSGQLEFLSSSKGFMMDDSGVVVTTNGGASWSFCLNNPNAFWGDLFFYDQNTGYATAIAPTYDSIYVYKTINGGTNWTPCTVMQDWNVGGIPFVYFRTSSEGYVIGSDQIHKTSDGGITWTSVYTAPGPDFIATISAPDPTYVYCATQYYVDISKSTDGGNNWISTGQTLASPAYGSYFLNSNTGFICGGNGLSAGYIVQTTDGGNSWAPAYSTSQTLMCMDFPSNSVGYCGGTGGLIVKYDGPMSIATIVPSELSCFPNPANDLVTIESISPGSEVTLANAIGQIVFTATATDNRMLVDLSNLNSGIYFLRVRNAEYIYDQRIMKE